MKKKIELLMAVLILMSAFILAKEGSVLVNSSHVEKKENCIVIDAGHGGADPGKIGINDALEKDVNLKIALQLQAILEKDGKKVILTRKNDNGLYSADASNKKVEDMRRRCEIITDEMPVFTVSIHQNSYPEEYVKGAQVFYYGQSAEGKELAETIQCSLKNKLDPENNRMAKANESYYLLKKTPTPTVIVECGFLSNQSEADLLITPEYQKKVASAIAYGIKEYLGENEKDTKKKDTNDNTSENTKEKDTIEKKTDQIDTEEITEDIKISSQQ